MKTSTVFLGFSSFRVTDSAGLFLYAASVCSKTKSPVSSREFVYFPLFLHRKTAHFAITYQDTNITCYFLSECQNVYVTFKLAKNNARLLSQNISTGRYPSENKKPPTTNCRHHNKYQSNKAGLANMKPSPSRIWFTVLYALFCSAWRCSDTSKLPGWHQNQNLTLWKKPKQDDNFIN